jgi:hypothetical protein
MIFDGMIFIALLPSAVVWRVPTSMMFAESEFLPEIAHETKRLWRGAPSLYFQNCGR